MAKGAARKTWAQLCSGPEKRDRLDLIKAGRKVRSLKTRHAQFYPSDAEGLAVFDRQIAFYADALHELRAKVEARHS